MLRAKLAVRQTKIALGGIAADDEVALDHAGPRLSAMEERWLQNSVTQRRGRASGCPAPASRCSASASPARQHRSRRRTAHQLPQSVSSSSAPSTSGTGTAQNRTPCPAARQPPGRRSYCGCC